MTTIAAALKDGRVAIAADTQVSGYSVLSAPYMKDRDKIIKVNDSYVGFTGYSASILVAEHLMATEPEKFNFNSRFEIFSTLLRIQKILKDDYFISSGSDDGGKSPAELNQLNFLVINRQGIFDADEYRNVQSFTKFWSVGSGSCYALGAMEVLYDMPQLSAEDIVSKAVEAAAKFDDCTGLPLQLHSTEYAPLPEDQLSLTSRLDLKLAEKREETHFENQLEKEKDKEDESPTLMEKIKSFTSLKS